MDIPDGHSCCLLSRLLMSKIIHHAGSHTTKRMWTQVKATRVVVRPLFICIRWTFQISRYDMNIRRIIGSRYLRGKFNRLSSNRSCQLVLNKLFFNVSNENRSHGIRRTVFVVATSHRKVHQWCRKSIPVYLNSGAQILYESFCRCAPYVDRSSLPTFDELGTHRIIR
jgi:hypothetical protein